MTDQPTPEEPTAVPARAKQAGETHARWGWVEAAVWTERMLTALDEGVKGGRWFSLMDKVYAPANLRSAFARVKANGGAAGVDHQTIEMFEHCLEENLTTLANQLREGRYQPQPIRRVWIPKPGRSEKRPLGIPTVRDRVVQGAVRNVLEPIFEREFAERSYGFRPQRGCKDALRRVDQLLKQGATWVVDADLKSYFDTIPQEPLMERVKEKVADGRVLELLQAFLRQGVMDGLEEWTPERGTPQGAVLSPLLANVYLNSLDWKMEEAGYEMVRYADDFVILCHSEAAARAALSQVIDWTAAAGLSLHAEKTRVIEATAPGGFDFLGYHFEGGHRRPRRKSLKKFKDTLRLQTRRTQGHSLAVIISDVNRTLRGWFEYYKHSHRYTFSALDQWLRMRLRSVLRHRQGRRGRGRGRDHQRWPNAYFQQQGLFSLVTAHACLCQSRPRG